MNWINSIKSKMMNALLANQIWESNVFNGCALKQLIKNSFLYLRGDNWPCNGKPITSIYPDVFMNFDHEQSSCTPRNYFPGKKKFDL